MDYKKLLVDTSAWLSFLLKNEQFHQQIKIIFAEEQKKGSVFYTTNDIVDETVTRLIYDNNRKIALQFMDFVEEGIKSKVLVQFWTDEEIQEEAFESIRKFKDQKLSLTDATSVVIMKRFKLDSILTLDSDFKKIGIPSMP